MNMSSVYDGKVANDLTKDELIKAILRDCEVPFEEGHIRAMEAAFSEGWKRGEDFGREYYK